MEDWDTYFISGNLPKGGGGRRRLSWNLLRTFVFVERDVRRGGGWWEEEVFSVLNFKEGGGGLRGWTSIAYAQH